MQEGTSAVSPVYGRDLDHLVAESRETVKSGSGDPGRGASIARPQDYPHDVLFERRWSADDSAHAGEEILQTPALDRVPDLVLRVAARRELSE
jgi:hypothetical protein